jgi:uncharacterized membrane protein YphA (DoxX/SURF4 family)
MAFVVIPLRILLSTILISTAWSKIIDFDEHVRIVSNYKIIPNKLNKYINTFAILLIISEIATGVLLLINLLVNLSLAIFIAILLLYVIAISFNLLKGNVNVLCGCGGILGNQNLSWSLVSRNILFILISVFLILCNIFLEDIDSGLKNNVSLYVLVYCSLLIFLCVINLAKVYKFIQKQKGGMKFE